MARIIYTVGACPKGANWDTPPLSSPDAAKSETVATIVVRLRADKGAIEVQVVCTRPGVRCTRPVAAERPHTAQRATRVVVEASVDKTKRRLSELSRTSRVICNVVGSSERGVVGRGREGETLWADKKQKQAKAPIPPSDYYLSHPSRTTQRTARPRPR